MFECNSRRMSLVLVIGMSFGVMWVNFAQGDHYQMVKYYEAYTTSTTDFSYVVLFKIPRGSKWEVYTGSERAAATLRYVKRQNMIREETYDSTRSRIRVTANKKAREAAYPPYTKRDQLYDFARALEVRYYPK